MFINGDCYKKKKLKTLSKGNKIMNKDQIKRFIMFYERITKSMLKETSKFADITIKLDTKHRLTSIKIK